MLSLTQIALGWYHYKKGSVQARERMLKRLKICDGCPNKRQVNPVEKVIVKITGNDPRNLFKCGLCGCLLAALASLPHPACHEKKWPE
jgi:hypothetical protein